MRVRVRVRVDARVHGEAGLNVPIDGQRPQLTPHACQALDKSNEGWVSKSEISVILEAES